MSSLELSSRHASALKWLEQGRLFLAELTEQAIETLRVVAAAPESHAPVALATALDGELRGRRVAVDSERTAGQLGLAQLDQSVTRDVLGCLDQGLTPQLQRLREVMGSDIRVYIQAGSLRWRVAPGTSARSGAAEPTRSGWSGCGSGA